MLGQGREHSKVPRGKRTFPNQHNGNGSSNKKQKRGRKRERDMKTGSAEEVLAFDIRDLLSSLNASVADVKDSAGDEAVITESAGQKDVPALPEEGSEIEVEVMELSSTGDALAVQKGSDSKRLYLLPFAVPGDIVKVKVFRHLRDEKHSIADFVSVIKPSPLRDDSRVQCKYFSKCSGCQFQMLDYPEQLRVKKRIVERAYKNFSQLPPELIPAIQDTIGSPLQYGYRTKLTPHFDGTPGRRDRKNKPPLQKMPDIGFMPKGRRTTMDIEDCPIGTDAVRMGMKAERERMAVEFGKYSNGATILLRESTMRISKEDPVQLIPAPSENTVKAEAETYTDHKTCVTDNNGVSIEYVGDYVFHNPAGSFFQNNNSIIPVVTDYIRDRVLPLPKSSSPSSSTIATTPEQKPIKYLIDAYSGSGLFTITLSSLFPGGSTGIDISDKSIVFARRNAEANHIPASQANFIAADAKELFKSVKHYDADETVVVLDPPRKGCDENFLNQLLEFAPKRIVYVSCNVHTQARDVGMLVRGAVDDGEGVLGRRKKIQHEDTETEEVKEGEGHVNEAEENKLGPRYEIESLRGFDFFPQTAHVEGVAILNRVEG